MLAFIDQTKCERKSIVVKIATVKFEIQYFKHVLFLPAKNGISVLLDNQYFGTLNFTLGEQVIRAEKDY